MSTQTDRYMNSAKAFNNFFSMLHHAMLESMPNIEISGSGAWGWRGYRVDSFKDLARGLFYCQIYAYDPNILIFKESYNYPPYHPIDPRDTEYGIKSGDYYHPFWITLNLFQLRFFYFTEVEQFELLRNFVSYAALQAGLWQKSELRARPEITSKEYLLGNNKISPNPLSHPNGFQQVPIDYLDLLPLQESLFGKLESVLESILGKNIKWFLPNAAWQNWGFRGYRLNISGGDSADYVWEIYYKEPEKLNCYLYGNGKRKLEGYLDICTTEYFDQNDEQKEKTLRKFVSSTLGQVIS